MIYHCLHSADVLACMMYQFLNPHHASNNICKVVVTFCQYCYYQIPGREESSELLHSLDDAVGAIQKTSLMQRIHNEEELLAILHTVDMYSVCAGLPASPHVDNYMKIYNEWPHSQKKKYGICIKNGHLLSSGCSILVRYAGVGRRWTSCSACCMMGKRFWRHVPVHKSNDQLLTYKNVIYNFLVFPFSLFFLLLIFVVEFAEVATTNPKHETQDEIETEEDI